MFSFQPRDLTDITVLLDRSGSMQAIHQATVQGFASFVEQQRSVPGDCRFTLAQFDTHYELVYQERPVKKVGPLVLEPRGGTALLDAMGRVIQDTANRLAHVRMMGSPSRIIVVIITDGQENSSRNFTRPAVFDLVRHYTETRDWQFVFLGANQDAIREASQLGIDRGAAMTYAAEYQGTCAAWDGVARAVSRHRQTGAKRVAGDYFNESERNAARKDQPHSPEQS